ncbi:MAG: hypothetical protein CL910_14785 [Deltaproteobacteria bacterium]|jgi:heterodisulfide reductase subunit D|nr:hypothetical protein [Deltaproteobacteria bacterium]
MSEYPELEKLREMAFICNRCGACREKFSADMTEKPAFRVCPIREHDGGFEHQCARGRLTIAQALLEGEITYSPELIESIYTDPDCGLCTWVCDSLPLLDPVAVWRAMKRDIAASDQLPEPLREQDRRIQTTRNTFGAKAERAKWARALGLPREGELLYFAGCYASYTQTEIARATVAILRHVGFEPAYLGELEWCCGYGADMVSSMSPDLATRIAADRMDEARESGAEALVTACPRCARGLSKAGEGMKVYDLAVALARSMGLSF